MPVPFAVAADSVSGIHCGADVDVEEEYGRGAADKHAGRGSLLTQVKETKQVLWRQWRQSRPQLVRRNALAKSCFREPVITPHQHEKPI